MSNATFNHKLNWEKENLWERVLSQGQINRGDSRRRDKDRGRKHQQLGGEKRESDQENICWKGEGVWIDETMKGIQG